MTPETRLIRLMNDLRQKNDLGPLEPNRKLTRRAEEHAEDMADDNFFDHRGFEQRARGFVQAAENIAWNMDGFATASRAFEGWVESDPHLKNMLTPDFDKVGVGRARSATSGRVYWVAIYAS